MEGPKQSEESDYEEKFQLTEADQEWLNGEGPFGPFGGNGNGKSKSKSKSNDEGHNNHNRNGDRIKKDPEKI